MSADAALSLPAAQRRSLLRPALLLILSSLFATLESVLVRGLGDSVGIGQILLFRGGEQAVLALLVGAVLNGEGAAMLRTSRLGGHAARGLLACVSWWAYFRTFALLDLPLATTVTFTTQLFVVLFAWPVLRERVSGRSLAATLLGFAGVVVAARLWESGSANLGVFYGLACSAGGALMILITRSLSQTDRTSTILFYMAVVVTITAVPQAAWDWRPLDLWRWIALVSIGLLGTTSTALLIEAYRLAEAPRLAPYPYSRLIFAALLGFLIFDDRLTLATIVGAALIVASNLEPLLPRARPKPEADS